MTKLFAAVGLSVALIAVASPVHAQPPDPCKADIEKFCAKVEKGEGRLVKCLDEHAAELSADCTKARGERKRQAARPQQQGRSGGMGRVCNAEIEKFCKSAIGKGKEMANCLNEHKSDLSSECKTKVEQVMKKMKETPPSKDKS